MCFVVVIRNGVVLKRFAEIGIHIIFLSPFGAALGAFVNY